MKKELIRDLALVALASVATIAAACIITINNINKDSEKHIFASKVSTINKVYNQYETSNVTGYSNCIKSNSKELCLKRMESISIHFANEYNKKLLKLITDEYGIDTIENKASGRLTAIGVKKTNLEYIADNIPNPLNPFAIKLTDSKYSISFKETDSRIPTFAEAYGMNEIRKGEEILLSASLNKGASKDIKDIAENKDEVVSIGNKFAELGLKAQLDAYKEIETPDLMKLLELEQANNVNSGGIGKAPSMMDKTVQSGKQFFDTYTKAFKESASKPIEDNK
ncbi:hypothetical protein SOX05_08885 [Pseudomonas putida]|nr:hypothetical protein [Pseudomonas putida]MDY4319377.1 hypothetical protein [Pseudomonas putida]MDY4352762.1 hypothetical protein [Pseudomonas putida]